MNDKYVVLGDEMTHDLQNDCLTWEYRKGPPKYVQQEIDNMSAGMEMEMSQQDERPVYKSRRPEIGKKKNYGYEVPDGVNGKPTHHSEGTVKEALFGWRGYGSEPDGISRGVTFEDDRPDSGIVYKENMFDLLAHKDLAENQIIQNGRRAGSGKKGPDSAGPKRCPKDPRKNMAYVNRTNAISAKYNKVEHKPWKLPKFEKVPGAVSSFRNKKEKEEVEHAENPLNDDAYPGIDGKSLSRGSGVYVTSQMDKEPPSGGKDNYYSPAPSERNRDGGLFDV